MSVPSTPDVPLEIAAEVSVDGHRWRIERAWPGGGPDGWPVSVEARAGGMPGVRSGTLGPFSPPTLFAAGYDPRLPALAEVAREGTVVSHRAGRRAVVRHRDGYSKVVRPGRGAGVLAAHLRARASGFGTGFALADAWSDGVDLDRGIVHFSTLPGRTLHELGADPAVADEEFTDAWGAWGHAWVRSLASSRSGSELPVHDAESEVEVVHTWAAHAARVLPARACGIHEAAARVAVELRVTRPGPLVLSHRDLHDKQVLHTPVGRPGILDLDTASRAEAALDLGNLRAHVAFRAEQGQLSAARAQSARRIVDAVADVVGVSRARLSAYEAATMLRLGCLYLYRPAWRRVAEHWLTAIGA